jgi:hypothetical protein
VDDVTVGGFPTQLQPGEVIVQRTFAGAPLLRRHRA